MCIQYYLEKKGKNLGMTENRLFNIQNNKIYQVNPKGEEKELPLPKNIVMVKRDGARWLEQYDECKAFIML